MHQGPFSPAMVVRLGENAAAQGSFALASGDQRRAPKIKALLEVSGVGLHTEHRSECDPGGAVFVYMSCEVDTWF